MSTLHQTIQNQAVQFAEAIVQALRGASLDELVGFTGGAAPQARTAPSPRAAAKPRIAVAAAPKARATGGRLGRRSAEDISNTLEQIVSVLSQSSEGLRSEQIQSALGLDKREMPRPLAEGLKSGVISKMGQKRSTTYYAGKRGKR